MEMDWTDDSFKRNFRYDEDDCNFKVGDSDVILDFSVDVGYLLDCIHW